MTSRPLLRFFGYARRHWTHLAASGVATILFVILSATLIWLIGPLVSTLFSNASAVAPATGTSGGVAGFLDQIKAALQGLLDLVIVRPDPLATLARLCVTVILISLLKNILRYLQTLIVAVVQQRVIKRLRGELFAHYHDLSLAYFTRTRSGQIISRVVHDVSILNDMLDMAFNRLLRDPLLVLVLFGSLFVISWRLTLLALIILPLSMVVMTLAGRFIRRYSRRAQERMADLSSILEETVGGVRVVKAFGMEHHERARFGVANLAFYRAMVKMFRVRHLNAPINEFLGTIAGVLILWVGGKAVLGGAGLAPGEFLTYIFLMFSIIEPIKSLATVHARIAQGRAAAERIFEALDTPVDLYDLPGARLLIRFEEAVTYRNVGFRYGDGDWVLQDIDLTIPRGSSVALVGPSGGGKSTLCDLLARFYDPQEGIITIDGTDLRTYTIASLRAHLGVVTQDVILFNETVAQNIAYGVATPDPDRLRRAATAANALEFIEQLRCGFDTVIGPRGMTLSGGQRQRLAVARAIYKDPPILIFDEATSALDTESEIAVQRAIDNLLRDRTALIVAHRLSTVRNADCIAVVDKGRIVASGSHESLMAQDGLYRRLYEMQFADTDVLRDVTV
ncbi:MAG TPA: ABC transporter ATP-binding protein [Acidobacteriota bacterium]|nr:ABC transporter ATP-binding protein [Acidobacteriota bacterium]